MKTATADNTPRKTTAPTKRDSNGSPSCCTMGGLAGVGLLVSGVDLALGGVLADRSLYLSGIEVPLSCLASAMVLAGVYLSAITRRPRAPIEF